jgi:hypothetical protein
MKLKDLKPGQVYAFMRSKNYDARPMMFLSADLYHERSSNTRGGPYFRKILNPSSYDKPKGGMWGAGSTGYAIAMIGSAYTVYGDFPKEDLEVLRTANLPEFERVTGMSPDALAIRCTACSVELEEDKIPGTWKHPEQEGGWDHLPVLPPDLYKILTSKRRHRVITYDVLTSLAQVKGPWEEVTAALALEKLERQREHDEAKVARDQLKCRYEGVAQVLNDFGIETRLRFGRNELDLSIDSLEKIARVVRWARRNGMANPHAEYRER